ncbi:UPF0481 protein At3g47200-like [Fagus crenata]
MAVNRVDSVAIDIEGSASSIEDIASNDLFMSPNCCIFKTPTILYRFNEKAYVPDAFSIGPFHHGHPNLTNTQKIKKTEVQREACECYSIPIGYSSDEFIKILVSDGCFIIELFRKKVCKELRENNDPIFNMACMRQFLFHDLISLENQVPWMVLERLFNMTMDSEHHMHALNQTCHAGKEGWQPMPSATSLEEAGIKFRRGTASKSILDIKFNDGVSEIPPLLIQETTETVFTSYAILVDNLINSAKDADILSKNEIIDNWLSPEDAVQFFSKFYHNTCVKDEYYSQSLTRDVSRYCQCRWPRWRVALVRNYFNTPWAILSTLATVILLILSFLQTWYTMMKK